MFEQISLLVGTVNASSSVGLVICASPHRVPQYSDVYFQLRHNVLAQTADFGKRQSSKDKAMWRLVLRHRHRSQILGSPSKYSQRHRERGCAYNVEEMRW